MKNPRLWGDINKMDFILQLIYFLCQLLSMAIFGRAILSWFPMGYNNPIIKFLVNITEPVLAPLRRVIPRIGMIDITPMIAIILLQAIAGIIQRI